MLTTLVAGHVMFVCEKCTEKSLTDRGKQWPFGSSYGPCELCKKTGNCKDVPSNLDWAWKDTSTKLKNSDKKQL